MKIIQIAVSAGGNDNNTDILYALTDTGRVFKMLEANYDESGLKQWDELPRLVANNIGVLRE